MIFVSTAWPGSVGCGHRPYEGGRVCAVMRLGLRISHRIRPDGAARLAPTRVNPRPVAEAL
ncbi:hypothetical protein SAMN06264365_113147 [Actinoplanes regularis]|uniref:Uncharacterized protein n=1 Tax=Actinoplanes regularis TaxID=52697 RepID=A0A239DFZ1_9ACTN|nr:hypothetical protein Are01nite_52940 [Actinoplanes regularis]SNS31259.1 hypothetical protein SAMN06264365_113147 [Actinoplanes regularis]